MIDKKSFKSLEDELASVLNRIENADYDDLDDLLADYEKGSKIIAELEKRLKNAKNQIVKAKTKDSV
jgi:exodeoxyribonuclease VII small subunit